MPRSILRATEPDPPPETAGLTGVTFGYADAPSVLRDVNLTLERGSFHFLTGPSGSGKSTLIRLLTLAARPVEGQVRLFGRDVTEVGRAQIPALRRRIGAVFQDFRLLDHVSAFENVALPLRVAGVREADYAGDVQEMLAWVGLADRASALPAALSGGEKQRLAIARAVIARPELIVADEPTGSVDPVMGERLMKLFQAMNRMGVTVLIATHDEPLTRLAGARRWKLAEGRLSEAWP